MAPDGTRFELLAVDDEPTVGARRVRIVTADGREVIVPLGDLQSLLEFGWPAAVENTEDEAKFEESGATVGAVQSALNRSRALIFQDPRGAEEAARFALRLAETLDPRSYGGALVRDQQALAEACLANALRVGGNLALARRHMARARCRLALGRPHSREGIAVRELEVSLWRDLRDFEAALEVSEGVLEDHRTAGRRRATVRALLIRATLWEAMGKAEFAIPLLREAVEILPAGEGDLSLWAAHNLSFALARAGRRDEATALFERWRPLYRRQGERPGGGQPAILARRDWLEGLLADEPVDSLTSARRRFQAAGFDFDAALVALDLAAALASAGRHGEVFVLAGETHRDLASRGVDRDALMALLQVQQAVRESPRHLLRTVRQAALRLQGVLATHR